MTNMTMSEAIKLITDKNEKIHTSKKSDSFKVAEKTLKPKIIEPFSK